MLTLEKYLSSSHPPASFGAGIQRLVHCSLYAARLLSKDAQLLDDLLQNHNQVYAVAAMQQFLDDTNIADEITLKKALRRLRQRTLLRLMYRDLNGLCDLFEVMQTTSHLAEVTLQTAVNYHQAWMELLFGKPRNLAGEPQQLIIVGMGKLGGAELNVSSDVDLIFSFEHTGETDGANATSNQDFFNKLGNEAM